MREREEAEMELERHAEEDLVERQRASFDMEQAVEVEAQAAELEDLVSRGGSCWCGLRRQLRRSTGFRSSGSLLWVAAWNGL